MTLLTLISVACSSLVGTITLSGQVISGEATPLAGARVFLEPGLGGAVAETTAAPDGTFRFEKLGPGAAGVFAIAPGFGFGGRHRNIAAADDIEPLTLTLEPADSVAGRVTDAKGRPVAGARITRVGILGAHKVGIPLTKLTAFGFDEPLTDTEGRFTIPNLPRGGSVALKVGHPDYAQEGVPEAAVGISRLHVTLYPGVLVDGVVLSRGQNRPVARAYVVIQNAQPPNDSAATRSDGLGNFSMRLKPGVYLCRAAVGQLRSAGWTRLTVTGDSPQPKMRLHVAGTGYIRGVIKDAVTGQPIPGARVAVDTLGNRAAVVRTGPTGEFRVATAVGESTVRFESASGYLPPESPAWRVQVFEGQDVELPGIWLAPIPAFRLQVLGEDGHTPVSGAAVTLLRPHQFGWHQTDKAGWVDLRVANLPPDGAIVGMAEDLREPLGALFSLSRDQDGEARVQLFRLATTTGRVANGEGQPLGGIVVGAMYPGEAAEQSLLLWRGMTREDGEFTWDAVVPGVPQCCVAHSAAGREGKSAPFNLEPGGTQTLGSIVMPEAVSAPSLHGGRLAWHDNPLIAGVLPGPKERQDKAALVIYCRADEAAMVIEGLEEAKAILPGQHTLLRAVVVQGNYHLEDAPFPVLSGKAPAAATTYLIDKNATVFLECLGLPPLRAFQRIP